MLSNLSDPYVISGAIGILLALILILFLGYKKGIAREKIFVCFIFVLFCLFIGAHLLFFLVNLPSFAEKYMPSVFDVQSFITAVLNASSGMVFYGGLYGAILGCILYTRITHEPTRKFLDLFSCSFPLVHAFGRIGCTLGGCCYGIEYHGICAIQYNASHIKAGISDHIADFSRFPVQPLEAICEIGILVLIVILYYKDKTRYSLVAIYLFVYGIVRFLDEFLRGDLVRGIWGPFSTSQWIALASVIGATIYFLRRRKQLKEA